ncbi:proteophosphoglycan [Rhodotorula toruloides]|uniref:Proteophosphoglycan n=1 Tax=Rhodotorula toruloides TaxID=5286 RepID=A0A511K6V7_RHOTO|nr:proteophosphoglycan [Rhodotorula toruloides]
MASKTGASAGRGGAGSSKRSKRPRRDFQDKSPIGPLVRQPSGDAASSSSGLTYATIPIGLPAQNHSRDAADASSIGAGRHDLRQRLETGPAFARPVLQRAPSPFNAPPSADAGRMPIDLPPSAFMRTVARQTSYSLPPIPALLSREGTSKAEDKLAEGHSQPVSRLNTLHAIVQQGQVPVQTDPVAKIDRWRAQVEAETQRSGKRATSLDPAFVDADVVALPSKASASTDAVRPASSLSPALPPKQKKGKGAAAEEMNEFQDAARLKKAPNRKRIKQDNHASASSPERVISSKTLVKMLPKRRKVFGRAKENKAESGDEETDYGDFSSPHHHRRGVTKKRAAASRAAGKAGKEVKATKRDNSDTERRKEKARQKWQEIDDFQLETLPTL